MASIEARLHALESADHVERNTALVVFIRSMQPMTRIDRIGGPQSWTRSDGESEEAFRRRAIDDANHIGGALVVLKAKAKDKP